MHAHRDHHYNPYTDGLNDSVVTLAPLRPTFFVQPSDSLLTLTDTRFQYPGRLPIHNHNNFTPERTKVYGIALVEPESQPQPFPIQTTHVTQQLQDTAPPPPKDLRFWIVIAVINLSYFLSLLEATSISTALPTIITALHGSDSDFIWVGSAYNIAATAFIPLSGGLAQALGRRPVLLASLLLFGAGSLICAIAQSMNVLIAGRAVQGSGAAGLTAVSSIILSDVVSLKERGAYNGLIQLTWCIAAGIGPAIGGALAHARTWRWLFYLNLPLVGLIALPVLFLLRLKTPEGSVCSKLAMMDWIGSFLIVGSSVSIALGVTWAGVTYPWGSLQVLVPLCVGLGGLVVFFVYEIMLCKRPLVPYEAVANRTSLSGYFQILFSAIPFVTLVFYLPLYFQSTHASTPLHSGIQLFPLSFTVAPLSILTGLSITRTGRYRPQTYTGWTVVVVALALLSTVTSDTQLVRVLAYEAVAGVGFGIVYSAVYFPVLAPLEVAVTPRALAFFAFVRQFAGIWAVTIGGTILQNYTLANLPPHFSIPHSNINNNNNINNINNINNNNTTTTTTTTNVLSLISHLAQLPEPQRAAVRHVIGEGLRRVWIVMAAIAGAGLLVSLAMKGLPLSGAVSKKWGVEERQRVVRVRLEEGEGVGEGIGKGKG